MTATHDSIRFLSWNVKGVGTATKLVRVMVHLNQLKGDICFIQENHMLNKEVAWFKRNWVGTVYHSTFNSKARGVAILIRKGIAFVIDKSVSDSNGRYVMITGTIQGTPLLLVCVYGPNWDDYSFITKMFAAFPNVQNHYIIMGG